MKKTICVILSLIMAVTFLFAGCSNTTPGGVVDVSGVDSSNNELVFSDNKIEEGETTLEENLGLEVEAFVSGTYYLEGLVYSEGEIMPVIFASDGTNYQFTANYSGIAFGMLILDGSTYVVLPKAKQYTELSETLLKALDLDGGLGVDDFQKIAAEGSDNSKAKLSQYSVTINGDPGLCTVYTFDDSVFKLYSIGDKLIQLENFDTNGNMTMQITVDKLTSQIPSDQLTLKGLEKTSVTSFIQSFISVAG